MAGKRKITKATQKKKKRIEHRNMHLPDVERPRMLNAISAMYRAGATDQTVADRLGISRQTLLKWRKQSQKLREASLEAKELADSEVEDALFKSCTAGNFQAQRWWLCNRQRDRWKYDPGENKDTEEDDETGLIAIPAVMEVNDAEGDMDTAAETGVRDVETGV